MTPPCNPHPCAEPSDPFGGQFIQVGCVEVPVCRNEPRTCSETLDTVAYGFYLAVDKIFLSNALGKQMSEAEIQIVFANGNRLPKNV